MLIIYKNLDLDVEFYEQKEEKEDGFFSLHHFVIIESATHKGDSIMCLLGHEQFEEIEEIILAILDTE